MVEVLLQWASSKSRDANSVMEPGSGKSLSFLPKYKQIQGFPDFKSGAPSSKDSNSCYGTYLEQPLRRSRIIKWMPRERAQT